MGQTSIRLRNTFKLYPQTRSPPTKTLHSNKSNETAFPLSHFDPQFFPWSYLLKDRLLSLYTGYFYCYLFNFVEELLIDELAMIKGAESIQSIYIISKLLTDYS